ncbi:MAG TPA: SUMF1/EgtB/PvdO family nonheme iron enzyme [Thermoanaerobaculia bacterium]|jgi:formylglycine-generating enzyme required for sulfatase activity
MRHEAFPDGVTREGLVAWYRDLRTRSKELFAMLTPEAYYERPIALRNPLVFYEGHLPAFAVNTLIKGAQGRRGIDERFEALFARGIDPDSEDAVKSPTDVWPSRDDVQAYADAADALILDVLGNGKLEDDAVPQLRGGEAVFTILEHEAMHQETLLYMLHNLPHALKRAEGRGPRAEGRGPRAEGGNPAERSSALGPRPSALVSIPRGRATLGAARDTFGWDNEFASFVVDVDAFSIARHNVTNGEWLAFMEATGAGAPHFWVRDNDTWMFRGMFANEPLLLDAPVYVTYEQAAAYARWKGMRLPTEAEFHRAAYGTPGGEERLQPWGDELPDATRGNFGFSALHPVGIGSHPRGASAWGVEDLVGNGWEWTSSLFGPFDGFAPMPSYREYSVDFFDSAHYVLKGASPVTPKHLVRRSFRNWFRPNYPYVYATFRLTV